MVFVQRSVGRLANNYSHFCSAVLIKPQPFRFLYRIRFLTHDLREKAVSSPVRSRKAVLCWRGGVLLRGTSATGTAMSTDRLLSEAESLWGRFLEISRLPAIKA